MKSELKVSRRDKCDEHTRVKSFVRGTDKRVLEVMVARKVRSMKTSM